MRRCTAPRWRAVSEVERLHRGYGPLASSTAARADRLIDMRWSTVSTIQVCFAPDLCTGQVCVSQYSRGRATSSWAFASASVISYGRAINVKRTSPCETIVTVLEKNNSRKYRLLARQFDCETAANWPRKPHTGIESCATAANHDLWNASRRSTCGTSARPPGEYLRHAPTNTLPARPAEPTAWPTFANDRRPCLRSLVRSKFRSRSIFLVSVYCLLIRPIQSKKVNAAFSRILRTRCARVFSRAISRSCSEPEKAAPTWHSLRDC